MFIKFVTCKHFWHWWV